MKTCVVTGGAGFIGSHVADRLIKKGYRVVVLDNLSTGKRKNLHPKAVFYKIDIQSPRISDIFKNEKPDFVFHFAAHTEARQSVHDPLRDARENILGTLSILEQCRKHRTKNFIFASSGGEIYGDARQIPTPETYEPNPISPYGVAKFAAEKYIMAYGKLYAILPLIFRFGNVYGPRQNPNGEAGVVAIFTKAMLEKRSVYIHGKGTQRKDYIFIDDVADAVLKAFEQHKTGIFNIGTQKETSVNEIFSSLRKLTHSNVKPIHIKPPLILFKLGVLSIAKAKHQLQWKPKVAMQKGLQKTVQWLQNN